MLRLNEIIDELKKFSNEIITIGGPINDDRVIAFETKNGVVFPLDFKDFISRHNGVDLMGTEIYGLHGDEKKIDSIESVFYYEHNEVVVPMHKHLIPFSPDGRGNFYCLDTLTNNESSCNVVFWTSNYNYDETDQPEITHSSFLEWTMDVLIGWTLEDYDYNGYAR